ncbi:hypothetical protein EYD10_08658 [Varanus komodoensis]|nr:hypothetical protein EYD10_08658 [Varanus komodoensis]
MHRNTRKWCSNTEYREQYYIEEVPNFHKCVFSASSKDTQFQRHMRDHEQNDKPHRCDQCPMSFNVEFNLRLHKCTHNGENPTCPVCNKKFSRVASLKAHIMLHEKEENLICSECGDEFTLQSQLALHMEEHRQELSGGKTHICKTCKKEVETSSQLKEHMKTHYKIRVEIKKRWQDYIEDIYKKELNVPDNHNGVVTDLEPDILECEAKWALGSLINNKASGVMVRIKFAITFHCLTSVHRVSNTRSYNRNIDRSGFTYSCSHCGKTFQKPSQLTRHVRIHTGERPFKCSECGKAFNQKGALQTHMIKHTGEKPHACAFCPAAFSQKGNLQSHVQRVHSEDSVPQPLTLATVNLLQPADSKWKTTENPVTSVSGHQGQQSVSDVIQQLLELSEPVENNQSQQPGQQLTMAVGINRDILQQALENSGLSSIPVSANTDCNESKTPPSQDENTDIQNLSSHQVDSSNTEQVKEQENPEKNEKKEKRVLKKKSPFLPGSATSSRAGPKSLTQKLESPTNRNSILSGLSFSLLALIQPITLARHQFRTATVSPGLVEKKVELGVISILKTLQPKPPDDLSWRFHVIIQGNQGRFSTVTESETGLKWVQIISFIQEYLELFRHHLLQHLAQKQDVGHRSVIGSHLWIQGRLL